MPNTLLIKVSTKLSSSFLLLVSIILMTSCDSQSLSNVNHFEEGVNLYHQGLFDEAIEKLDKAVEADPNSSAPHEAKSEIYRMIGKLDLSLDSLNEAIKTRPVAPDNVRLYRVRGRTHDMIGNFDLAEKDFGSAISLSPKDATLYGDRAWFYFTQEKYYQSAEDWETSVNLNPSDISTAFYSSLTYYKLEDYKKVIDLNNAVIESDPGHGNAYNQIGEAYFQLGEYGKALASFDKAIELYGDRGIYYKNRGNTHNKLGNKELGKSDLKQACELNPGLCSE
jgi:tetratricopeptide (TPR) repeat protein